MDQGLFKADFKVALNGFDQTRPEGQCPLRHEWETVCELTSQVGKTLMEFAANTKTSTPRITSFLIQSPRAIPQSLEGSKTINFDQPKVLLIRVN